MYVVTYTPENKKTKHTYLTRAETLGGGGSGHAAFRFSDECVGDIATDVGIVLGIRRLETRETYSRQEIVCDESALCAPLEPPRN